MRIAGVVDVDYLQASVRVCDVGVVVRDHEATGARSGFPACKLRMNRVGDIDHLHTRAPFGHAGIMTIDRHIQSKAAGRVGANALEVAGIRDTNYLQPGSFIRDERVLAGDSYA